MHDFTVIIYDIENIVKPVKREEFVLRSMESRAQAADKAHDIAYKKYPNMKRLVEVRR